MVEVAEIKGKRLTLDGIIRANVGIFSNDTIFQEITQAELSKHGFKVQPITLEELSRNIPAFEIYLIDIFGVTNYSTLLDLITATKRRNPESKFVVLPTQIQLYSPEFRPMRDADVRNITEDIYKRPEVPPLDSEDGRSAYRGVIEQFVKVEIVDYLNKILAKPHIIKIGGSIFDLVERYENAEILERFLREIGDSHQTHPVILTAGGGPRQDVEKSLMRQLRLPTPEFDDYSRRALENQGATIASLLKRMGIDAVYVPPEDLNLLDVSGNYLRKRIPVVSLSNGQIPASESDTHTLSIADYFGIPDVKFAKNTDGVWIWDPNVKHNILIGKLASLGINLPEVFGKKNELLQQIYASEILAGKISRYGFDRDGGLSDNHVIETGALRYLLEYAKYVQRVHVINGTKHGTLRAALEGHPVGSYILKG